MNDPQYDDTADQYEVPAIAKLLHKLPHQNDKFQPNDKIYLKSLGLLGSVPAVLLIFFLLGLLIYLLTRCCYRKLRPTHSIASLKIALSLLATMCGIAIGFELYGNYDLHNRLLDVLVMGRKVDNSITAIRNETEHTLRNDIQPELVALADIFDQPVADQNALAILFTSLSMMQGNVTIAMNVVRDIRRPLLDISMTQFLSRGEQWEYIRWYSTLAMLYLLLVLCALLYVGVACHSRCVLIFFSVCGLMVVTGAWLMSGFYVSTSVAVGDLCISPTNFIASVSSRTLPNDVLLHYTQCNPQHDNPFTQPLRDVQYSLHNARNAMAKVTEISLALFKSSSLRPQLAGINAKLNSNERMLTQLAVLMDCKVVHDNLLAVTQSLCENGLFDLAQLLCVSFISATLLTILVWLATHTWIYMPQRNDYMLVGEPRLFRATSKVSS